MATKAKDTYQVEVRWPAGDGKFIGVRIEMGDVSVVCERRTLGQAFECAVELMRTVNEERREEHEPT